MTTRVIASISFSLHTNMIYHYSICTVSYNTLRALKLYTHYDFVLFSFCIEIHRRSAKSSGETRCIPKCIALYPFNISTMNVQCSVENVNLSRKCTSTFNGKRNQLKKHNFPFVITLHTVNHNYSLIFMFNHSLN